MKLVSIIVLSLLLTACGQRKSSTVPSDADIQKRLSGTWTNEMKLDDDGHRRWVGVYRPDGTYAAEATCVQSNKTSRVSGTGTFLVRDGVLIVTTTKRNGTNAPLPEVERWRIVRVDDRELVGIFEERPDVGPVTIGRKR